MNAPKWVKPVSTVLFMIGVGGLTWSGATHADLTSTLTITTGSITAVFGLIAAIFSKKKEDA